MVITTLGLVIFSHDTEGSLLVVVDFVNTARQCGGTERLPDAHHVQEFVDRHGLPSNNTGDLGDLASLHAIRDRLRRVFGLTDAAEIAAEVNALIAVAPISPRLTDHDGYHWHMHYSAPDARLADRLGVVGAMALAQVVSDSETERLHICEAPDCHAVLVDLTRNRSKRYCDARGCANRLHVAAYRERKRLESVPPKPL